MHYHLLANSICIEARTRLCLNGTSGWWISGNWIQRCQCQVLELRIIIPLLILCEGDSVLSQIKITYSCRHTGKVHEWQENNSCAFTCSSLQRGTKKMKSYVYMCIITWSTKLSGSGSFQDTYSYGHYVIFTATITVMHQCSFQKLIENGQHFRPTTRFHNIVK